MSGLNVLVLGMIISVIYYEITDISPGGIIVPGLLVMYITQPERILYTLLVALITYFLVKLLSKYIVIFGKRRFVLLIIISIFVNFLLHFILVGSSVSLLNISIIGYTIAGLIANDFFKQGIKKTIPSLIIVVGIIELIVIICNQIGV